MTGILYAYASNMHENVISYSKSSQFIEPTFSVTQQCSGDFGLSP